MCAQILLHFISCLSLICWDNLSNILKVFNILMPPIEGKCDEKWYAQIKSGYVTMSDAL